MNEQLRILMELQAVEKQRGAAAGRKAKLEADEVRRLWHEVRLLAQTIAADKEKQACLEKVCARQEADLAAATRQCRELEASLYSGAITSGKELEQFRTRCESARRDIAGKEDEAFSNMELCEQLGEKIAGNETLLGEKKRLHADKQQEITRAAGEIDACLAEIQSRAEKLSSQVDPELLALFRSLGRRLATPVAKLENGVCGGCRMSVPTSQAARQEQKLIYCDNCSRILLVE